MKTLRFKITIVALITMLSAFAQNESFKLANYKLPYLKRKALEAGFSASGTNDFTNSSHHNSNNSSNLKTLHLGSSFNIGYSSYLNSEKYQGEINTSVDFSASMDNSKLKNLSESKQNKIYSNLFFNSVSRFYFKPKSFVEISPLLKYNYQKYNYEHDNLEINTSKSYTTHNNQLKLQLPLKAGKGRIEQVQDARQAIYIMDKLAKEDRIVFDNTNDEVTEFANLIAELKNKRFFDARIRKIAEIEAIDSFLRAKQHVKQTDARYFTSLNDMWLYGNTPIRMSGTRISAALIPAFYYSHYNEDGDAPQYDRSYFSSNMLSLAAGLELKYGKPINLKWQNSIDARAYYTMLKGDAKDKDYKTIVSAELPNIQFSFAQTIAYYPNTRTNIAMGYYAKYIKIFDKSDETNSIVGTDNNACNLGININGNYYVSPQFRIVFAYNFSWLWQDTKNSGAVLNFNTSGSSGVIYPHLYGAIGNGFAYSRIMSELYIRFVYTIF